MKRILAFLLALVMTMSMAVCATAEEPVTITFGFWGDTPEANMKMELAKMYMEAHPNVTIEFEYTDGAGYLTKMQTWFSSNTAPDVFGVASDVLTQFMDNENFADLSTFIARDGMGEVWSANTIANIYTNGAGKVLAVPFISKVFAMAYNKTLFDEAGLAYPTDDWTVEDMLTAARALTKGTGVDAQYGLRWGVRPTEFYRNLYGTPVYNVGSQEINAVDNAGFKAALDLFTQTIAEGLAPNEASGAISTGGFETGRFGMQLSATWDIATLLNLADSSFEWDVVMLPINAELNQRMMTTYRGNGWCMNANTKQQEVCWDFIKFMSANEDAQRLAQAFGIPELTSFANSEEYLKDFGTSTVTYDKSVFLRMLENSVGFCNMGVYAQINDVMKNEYELVLAGKQTVDQMVINVQEQADALMAMPQ